MTGCGISKRDGLDEWCLHTIVANHSPRAADLLHRIVAVGESLDPSVIPATDLVHCDYHHRNVLVDRGRLVGVIDCEACQDGDRRFDLVTLAYWLGFVGAAPGVAEHLAENVKALLPTELRLAYVAHMLLRNVDFYARTDRPEIADLHVAYGEELLGGLGA